MLGNLFVINRSLNANMRHRGEVVFTYSVHYPQYLTPMTVPSLTEINTYYKQQAQYLVRSITPQLYKDAVADYESRTPRADPFPTYEFLRTFDTTYGQDCVISVYFDTYQFTGGAHGTTVRTADTWDARRARRIPLSSLFPQGTDYVARIQAAVLERITLQQQQDGAFYFDDAAALVVQYFNENSFYLTPEALVVFYQQYELAPYAAGIPTFAIPYAEVGARVPGC